MRKINIESIKQKILESSVTRKNIFALLESVEEKPVIQEAISIRIIENDSD